VGSVEGSEEGSVLGSELGAEEGSVEVWVVWEDSLLEEGAVMSGVPAQEVESMHKAASRKMG